MAAAILVERDIKDGRALIQQLDKDKFPVTAAFWYYYSEWEKWRLIVASPVVESHGQTEGYRRLIESLKLLQHRKTRSFALESGNIELVKPSDRLPILLGRAIRTEVRLSWNVIDGTLIEDAYIYRSGKIPAAQPRSKKPTAGAAARHP